MKKVILPSLLAGLVLCLIGCAPATDPEFRAPVHKPEATPPSTRFVRLDPDDVGITFVQEFRETYQYSFIFDPLIYNGGGVAVIDVDNDNLQDLFFISRQMECRLYRNKGDRSFEDITATAGVACPQGLKTGACVIDINADGWQDLYVCRSGLKPSPERVNLLFVNNGDGSFTERAAEYGLNDLSSSLHANFFDYDLDGDLDVYVLNQPSNHALVLTADFNPTPGKTARMQPPRTEHETDRLYRNDGPPPPGGSRTTWFTDVSKEAGIWNRAWGLSVTVSDLTGDAYPDIVIGNDFIMPDFYYINNGDGTFSDHADRAFRHFSQNTMGVDIADINNDALLDIVSLDMLAEPWDRRQRLLTPMVLQRHNTLVEQTYEHQLMRNALQLNNGNGTFSDVACLAGIEATDWSWAVLAADFDNNGWKDIFISNGIKRDLNDLDFQTYTIDSINKRGGVHPKNFKNFEDFPALMPTARVSNYMYQNNGSLQLTNVSEAWGFTEPGFGNGAAYVDLDNDGDLDLVVNNAETPAAVYENKSTETNSNHWLQIKCKGTPRNPVGAGAKIWVHFGDQVFYQEMTPIRGFYSSVEPIMQVGLGARTAADRIEVEWPEGRHQVLTQVPAGQRLILDIGQAQPGRLQRPSEPANQLFNETTATSGLDFVHVENKFEDFNRERLLPHRLSNLGPALAAGDVNGDKLDDVYVGGATGQPGALFIQKPNGTFARVAAPVFDSDKSREAVAAAFFDVEKDGDSDLYVVSGGNEAPAGSEQYLDRLYINDGKGNFSQGPLPPETASGSCVRPFDYNGDGSIDVFIGGRLTPGKYPQPGKGLVFSPVAGRLSDMGSAVAPDFLNAGMVTDLQFADLDGDGKAEMIVAGEWMPLKVYRYDGAKFTDATAAFGLENTTGWWNCLQAADLDGDGDIDLAAGNEGLNTRFRPTPEAPLKLFADDFDKNGSLDPIMALAYQGNYVPVARRDILVAQMVPAMVKKKYPRNASYSHATLTEIFPAEQLKKSMRFDAKMFQTAWFENQGGKFVVRVLPLEAQWAPCEQILTADFNRDGHTDLLTVGNNYGAEVETGRLDASNGCVLLGDGKGGFTAMPNRRSGLWASHEARDAVLVRSAGGKQLLVVANNNDRVQTFALVNPLTQ